ncbi:pre-rRNA-processing protein ESF1 [Coprinopsis sp. MPI-PUGE-AT-0042]|nr:pre-rRNA-processing protein ESF1 [Coprinopsis sp. MPI-PUGE-AT-0042]
MSDPRFARLKTDPRFKQIKKKQHKVVVDDRFKSILDQGKKKDKVKGQVDKYGRALSKTHEADNLKRFYRLENEEEAEADAPPARPDYARGEVLLESSDEEGDDGSGIPQAVESDDEGDHFVTLGGDESDLEVDLDEDTVANLDAQAKVFADAAADDNDQEQDDAPRTCRLAAVNLDWDHVRAAHLYKICSSLVSPAAPGPGAASTKTSRRDDTKNPKKAPQVNLARGKVLSVIVYPSDFGKERMAREEKEGPPAEIFKKQRNIDAEITEKSLFEVGGENEVNDAALRRYQLERLRYYYAVITCDTVEAASHIHDELQGTELERSANVFDLSFVPDGMTFENEPRDEATEGTALTVKPVEFVTDALRHSKVKLTWDEDDPERNHITRRALSKQEIEDGDFGALIASGSESEGGGESSKPTGKQKRKDRDRLRNLLLGGNQEAMPEGWGDENGDEVDMEITFTPGLEGKKDEGDETTLEKYHRKMREKRKKRKEEVKEKGKGKEKLVEPEDDFFGSDSETEDAPIKAKPTKGRKGDKKGVRFDEDEGKEPGEGKKREATAEELALLLASNNPNAEPQHFDFKAVVKAEKDKGKKKRKTKKGKVVDSGELQEDFVMDVQDDRFKVLHEDHQFAIDPSNPHFKKTKGMDALLQERRKHLQKNSNETSKPSPTSMPNNDGGLQKLVESVKRKSASGHAPGQGKRRKL